MIREILVFLAALIVAAIIHIATIFALPFFAENDLWHKVAALGGNHQMHIIATPSRRDGPLGRSRSDFYLWPLSDQRF